MFIINLVDSNSIKASAPMICWKKDEEMMSPVEAIGALTIKHFNNASSPPLKKINKEKNLPYTRVIYSKEEDFGLREDYKQLLAAKKGFPWDQIRLIEKPHFQEILISLYLSEKCEKSTLEFALNLSKTSSPETLLILGKLLFLADRFHPLRTSDIAWIEQTFDAEQDKVIERLKSLYLSHKTAHVQPAEMALMTQLSVDLAKLILTETGAVNFAIIPALIHHYIDEPTHPINHEINVMYTFDQLLYSPMIREKIAKITGPKSMISPANIVIRSVLNLPANEVVTDLHAEQVALSALLSHLRQGVDGSCFATPLVMGLLSSHLESCLDDFACLLSNGMLTRKIHGALKQFPFLLCVNNKSLNREITISRKGKIIQLKKPVAAIWEVPGIIKAMEAIGFTEKHQDILTIILGQLFLNETAKTKTITIRHIIQELSKYVAKTHQKILGSMVFSTAYFAFEGQTCNALLGVWENSIAGMAEGEEGSLVSSNIILTTTEVLGDKLRPPVKDKILEGIRNILRDRIYLHYDPMIHHTSHSKDQHTSEGAFVLYDKGEYDRQASWTRVDCPLEFQAFISRIIEYAKGKLDALYGKSLDDLLNYVETDEFLQKVVSQYFHKNHKATRSMSDYKKFRYAPWVTKSGNNFSKVIQVYFEFPKNFKSTLIHPQDQQDLFLKIVQYCQHFQEADKKLFLDNSHRCISARIPGVHAFSLIPGHPTFVKAWNAINPLEQVLLPGQKIAASKISEDLEKKMIHFVEEQLIAEELKGTAKFPKNLCISDFRNSLVQWAGLSDKQAQLLDSFLFQNLPEESRKALNLSAVHFADTNWCDGLNDLHFCFVVNPGTGKLEIWAAHDDQSTMQPLEQLLWLQDWEIFNC